MSLVAAASSSNGNMSGHVHKQLTRSLERIIEEAQLSGELKLSGRKLKDFPKAGKSSSTAKFNLQDTVFADLSKNRFMELPEEVTDLRFLEKLYLYHNAIRVIPDRVSMLQSLNYLDLSRNQLTVLPREVCRLPLQTLLVAYNRLEALPEELGRMSVLAELDAGCNEISSLPSRIGDLPQLRYLDIRSNLLVHIPIELTYLKLIKLDISGNRISILPNELRKMKSLVDLKLSDNPLTSPPAALCIRGRTHVFKYLERQAAKHERNYSGRIKRGPLEPRGHVTLDTRAHRRHNVGSGYSTSDGLDKRWSQELNSATIILQDHLTKQKLELNFSETGEELQKPILTTREIPNALSSNVEKVLHGLSQKSNVIQPFSSIRTINALPAINGDEKRSLCHIQTYREYKEALKQQRANDGASIYRPKEQVTPPDNDALVDGKILSENNDSIMKQIVNEDNFNKKPLQKALPSRIHQHNTSFLNGNCEVNCKNKKCYEQIYKKPSSPINTSNSVSPESYSSGYVTRLEKPGFNYAEGTNRSTTSPGSSRSFIWNTNFSQQYSFTMKREFERAKEEAELIEQLRNHIESRLKMTLPEDLASTLTDGVVLCHLANYVRPRSVGSIHVPSPAVPKLTMARCRRNVDNFLEACRKIGVDENLLCCASDVLEGGRGIVRVAVTVAELLKFYQNRSPLHSTASGTSAQSSTNN